MTLLRHACLGMDSCKVTLSDLRAADDGSALEPAPVEEEEIIIEPEEIIEDVAGVDSNGHVLMKHHEHPYHHYPGKVKVYYECDKIEENPFSFLESIFEDMIGEPEVTPEEDVASTEETPLEETPIILSKALGHHKCKTKLKNVAQDWDAGHVCGTASQQMTLSCDPARSATRIFVLNVTPKIQKRPVATAAGADSGVDPVIEDTTSSVENEPFLAKHGHHKHGAKGNKKQGKHLGWQLTDVCATQSGDCTTTLNDDLQLQAANPLIDETTPIHVKYLCSYEH